MRALITGISGQDGTYLGSLLSKMGYDVVGISSRPDYNNQTMTIHSLDMSKLEGVAELLKVVSPDEIYHLAAVHSSSEHQIADDFDFFKKSFAVNVQATLNILEAVYRYSHKTRIFFASSAQIFGNPDVRPQNELTPRNPNSIYGMTKLLATNLCAFYRRTKGLFVSVGILYNHESPLRGSDYASKKIALGVVNILKHRADRLVLGDLSAEVDWGFAPDYAEAMNRILRLDSPDDFVIATGETHSVEEFVKLSFERVGLDWRKYVQVDSSLLKREPKGKLTGDSSKLKRLTGWVPKTSFREMVRAMVDYELENDRLRIDFDSRSKL